MNKRNIKKSFLTVKSRLLCMCAAMCGLIYCTPTLAFAKDKGVSEVTEGIGVLKDLVLACVGGVGLWDSVTGFFSDLGDFFSGKSFFEMSGYVWSDLMKLGSQVLIKNPSSGVYQDTWSQVSKIYTALNTVAVTLMVLFFLYSFCRDAVDLHTDMTMDKTIKLFIRLIIVSNVMGLALTWMPKFMSWAKILTEAALGGAKFGFYFDGVKIYESIADASGWGALVAFLISFLFFLYTCVCGFMIVFTILNRIIKIYMIAPFAGVALSTLAGGGQVAQVGYSYIKTFFGYVLSTLLIAVVIVISTTFIDTISLESDSAIITLLTYCLKMGTISTSVKASDSVMQKAFGLQKEGVIITKQINQDVAGFKDDFFKGLSLRECIYGGIALGLGAGGMLALVFVYKLNINAAIMICMPFIAVIGLCGFYEKNGMTLPKIVKARIRIMRQKPLTYQTVRPEDRQSVYIIEREKSN